MPHSQINAFFTTKAPNGNLGGLLNTIGVSKDNVYIPVQKHTNEAVILESNMEPVVADAVLTKREGVIIGIQVADCVPVLLYDKKKAVIGAVHAGWRGTAGGILKNTISAMHERFGSLTEDIMIAIGPSIRECCYMVGEEVINAVSAVTGEGDYYRRHNGKYIIDLSLANRLQALSLGVPEKNIWQSGECTSCNPQKFHSYRYTNGAAGRQGGFIGINTVQTV
ncbi:MAG: peptidoglycan editing factor PgeF [Nitrospirae bacterium]|nr:peptidoglycan editing factor PgeF [Nitrospirota bacterium]